MEEEVQGAGGGARGMDEQVQGPGGRPRGRGGEAEGGGGGLEEEVVGPGEGVCGEDEGGGGGHRVLEKQVRRAGAQIRDLAGNSCYSFCRFSQTLLPPTPSHPPTHIMHKPT